MATRRFPNNQGHVLVIPNQHFENIFDLPIEITPHIHQLAKAIAGAMKATYHCDGILFRQQNEPAGGQHIWHYHLHIIPRYQNDDFNFSRKRHYPTNQRAELARKLSKSISSN